MKFSVLENIISFLLGVLWTLLGIFVLFTFLVNYKTSIIFALGMSVLMATFWLFWIVLMEMARVQIEKLKELQKQTRLLQSINDKLSHH